MELRQIEFVFPTIHVFVDDQKEFYRYMEVGPEQVAQKIMPQQSSEYFEAYVIEGPSSVFYALVEIDKGERKLVLESIRDSPSRRFYRLIGHDFAYSETVWVGRQQWICKWTFMKRQANGNYLDATAKLGADCSRYLAGLDYEGGVVTARLRGFEKGETTFYYQQTSNGYERIGKGDADKLIAKFRRVNVLNIPKGWKNLRDFGFYFTEDLLK